MNFLTKSEEASLSSYGKYPGSRTVEEMIKNGIIILDKPPGPSSHQVDAWIKQILSIDKCSHGGTLDPRVSGVLVIALQNTTKLMPILLSSKKEYVALVYLHRDAPKKDIERVCNDFIGKITQLPPKRSAVARREREREIYYLEILQISERYILMKVGCEAGTYIRRLADDIGKKLGTGAHLQELRRTKSGVFSENQCVTLHKLCDAVAEWKEGNEDQMRKIILPIEIIADSVKSIVIKDSAVDALCNGAPLHSGGISKVQENIERDDWVAILTLKGELIAIGKAFMNSEEMVTKKGYAVKTDRVLMKKDTYPATWRKANK